MKTFKQFAEEVKKSTGTLKKACWTGYTAVGMKEKNGRKVPNCVPEETVTEDSDKYHVLRHQTAQDIEHEMSPKAWTKVKEFDSFNDAQDAYDAMKSKHPNHKFTVTSHSKKRREEYKNRGVTEETELDEVAAWQRKEGKRESGGLNQKGVDSYRREHPGSKLKTAVTTKPSKLNPDSKAAKRRKSFCARMSGMKKRLTSAKTAHDPDSRINKSLRKWNC